MLERVAVDSVVFYRSPLLHAVGVPHAFSTRLGGQSVAPFDSMNLGNPNGCAIQDDYDNVWANYRTLQSACGLGGRFLARVHQVHGAEVVIDQRDQPFNTDQKADVIVSTDVQKAISVRVADCVPVLLASRDGCVVAAVHAGWRGTVGGALLRAIETMRSLGAKQIVAAVGPAISGEAFEVGDEVVAAFRRALGADAPVLPVNENGKHHIDIRAALLLQLLQADIPQENIDTTDRCTFRDRSEFFSHRRDNGVTGRMAALISCLE